MPVSKTRRKKQPKPVRRSRPVPQDLSTRLQAAYALNSSLEEVDRNLADMIADGRLFRLDKKGNLRRNYLPGEDDQAYRRRTHQVLVAQSPDAIVMMLADMTSDTNPIVAFSDQWLADYLGTDVDTVVQTVNRAFANEATRDFFKRYRGHDGETIYVRLDGSDADRFVSEQFDEITLKPRVLP